MRTHQHNRLSDLVYPSGRKGREEFLDFQKPVAFRCSFWGVAEILNPSHCDAFSQRNETYDTEES